LKIPIVNLFLQSHLSRRREKFRGQASKLLCFSPAGDTQPRSFEACLIRSCATALAQINGVTAISTRS
jgi:hypothetical protein